MSEEKPTVKPRYSDEEYANMSSDEFQDDLFDLFENPERREEKEAVVAAYKRPAPKETTFVTGDPYLAGRTIKDDDGNIYRMIENSRYISERDAAEMEDGFDCFVQAGYHTKAVLIREA